MPNILTLTAGNPDQLLNTGAYGAGAVIQVQSGADRVGPFNDETPTVPIVAGTTSYTFYDTDGTTATWYRTRYENAAGTTVSEWSTAFQPRVSLISLGDAQTRVGSGVTQAMIDEVEEAWAAVLGPLVGERTETFFLYQRRYRFMAVDGVYLTRTTDEVTLTTSTTTGAPTSLTPGTDYRLLNNHLIEHIDAGAVWLDELAATYTPNDEEIVRSVIFDTLTYRQTPSGVQSIRIGVFSETFFPEATRTDPVLGSLARRVLPGAGMGMTTPFRYAAHRRDRTQIVAT